MGDTPLWLYLSQRGKFHYYHQSTVVYRISKNSVSRKRSRREQLEFKLSGYMVRMNAYRQYGYKIPEPLIDKAGESVLEYYYLNGKDTIYLEELLFSNKIKNQVRSIRTKKKWINRFIILFYRPRYLFRELRSSLQR